MIFSIVKKIFTKHPKKQDVYKLYLQHAKIKTVDQVLSMYQGPDHMPTESKLKIVLLKRQLDKKLTDETVIRSISYSIKRIEQQSELYDFAEKFISSIETKSNFNLISFPPGKILNTLISCGCSVMKDSDRLFIVYPANQKTKLYFPEQTKVS